MSALEIGEVRALVRLFRGSDLRDLWIRTPGWSMFVAKPGAGANPGAQQPEPAPATPADPGSIVTAPTLGILGEALAVGSAVEAGSQIAVLHVLDERRPVAADRAGTVTAVLAGDGALVEFGEALVRIA